MHLMAVWRLVLSHPDIRDLKDLPRNHRKFKLPDAVYKLFDSGEFCRSSSKLVESVTSKDQTTTKLVIQLQDGQMVESVIIRHLTRKKPYLERHSGKGGSNSHGNNSNKPLPALTENALMQLDKENEEIIQKSGIDDHLVSLVTPPTPFNRSASSNSLSSNLSTCSTRSLLSAVNRVRHHTTLCVSSQVGCQMGCTFCATGTMGLMGNLCSGEILEQLMFAFEVDPPRNIVFMGMGEPLHNYHAVTTAIKKMVHPSLFCLARGRVTLSTVGIIPKMIQLTRDLPFVTLALSLHAPTQELRKQIVPAGKVYKIDKLIDALDFHIDFVQRRTLIEYVMLEGVNDSVETAHQLGKLLEGKNVFINLIPYNDTFDKDGKIMYKRPAAEVTDEFSRILRVEYKHFVTVRREMGMDIAGACGQLALTTKAKEGASGGCGSGKDMEDMFTSTERKIKPQSTLKQRKNDSLPPSSLASSTASTEKITNSATAPASSQTTYAVLVLSFCLLLSVLVGKFAL